MTRIEQALKELHDAVTEELGIGANFYISIHPKTTDKIPTEQAESLLKSAMPDAWLSRAKSGDTSWLYGSVKYEDKGYAEITIFYKRDTVVETSQLEPYDHQELPF